MDKQRFVLAIALSAVILLGWTLLFKPPTPQSNANANANANTSAPQQGSAPSSSPQTVATDSQSSTQQSVRPGCNLGEDTIPVTTPLYQVKLDKCGGVVTSWIISRNKENNNALYSVTGNKVPLELVWQGDEVNKRTSFDAPLRLA